MEKREERREEKGRKEEIDVRLYRKEEGRRR